MEIELETKKSKRSSWIKRRWYEFRIGHSVYMAFGMNFVNFILIVYNFLIVQLTFLSAIFTNILFFGITIAIFYIPLTTIIGHTHNKKQMNTDLTVQAEQNPIYIELKKEFKRMNKKLDNLQNQMNRIERENAKN